MLLLIIVVMAPEVSGEKAPCWPVILGAWKERRGGMEGLCLVYLLLLHASSLPPSLVLTTTNVPGRVKAWDTGKATQRRRRKRATTREQRAARPPPEADAA